MFEISNIQVKYCTTLHTMEKLQTFLTYVYVKFQQFVETINSTIEYKYFNVSILDFAFSSIVSSHFVINFTITIKININKSVFNVLKYILPFKKETKEKIEIAAYLDSSVLYRFSQIIESVSKRRGCSFSRRVSEIATRKSKHR